MRNPLPYRSWLFVPGNRPDRFSKALASGTDAVILDLEDGVAEAEREGAIANVDRFLANRAAGGSISIWVRVDESVARRPSVVGLANHASLDGFVIPKFEDPDQCSGWRRPVMAIIETPRGVLDAGRITRESAANLHGIALGPEDLSTAMGVTPNFSSLIYAASTVSFAAHAAGVYSYSCPGSLGEFTDLDAWQATLLAGREIGSQGSLCIHPVQVTRANSAFAPTAQEVEWATRVCDAWDAIDDAGTIALDGKMIDLPVVRRARNVIERHRPLARPPLGQ